MEPSTTTEFLQKTLPESLTRQTPSDPCWLMTRTVRWGGLHLCYLYSSLSSSKDDISLLYVIVTSPVGPTFDLSAFKDGLEVIVPQPLTIRVPITGYPTPAARWTFGEKEMSTADERVSLMTKSTFTELMVTPSVRPDKGIYTLHLENDVTSVSGEIEVNVIGTTLKSSKTNEKTLLK